MMNPNFLITVVILVVLLILKFVPNQSVPIIVINFRTIVMNVYVKMKN